VTPLADIPAGRQHLIPLADVQAPFPQLHDLVDEAFQALRDHVASRAGWDFMASLENAYVPLTVPLAPGMGQDWLYTGRAFAFNPLLINAGWVAVIPEPYGGETYWRVYLRARYQDGSQGMPLHELPWDFNARYSGDPRLYDRGGNLAGEVPAGYWVDFTALAQAYSWERLPALTNWRSAYPAARFNEFVQSNGLDWRTAIQELYPPEALVTPTALIPPTLTATPTPRWTAVWPTSTRTQPPAKPTQTPKPG
jgi:TolB protein